ncbi:MAG: FprA family A-type flavoprotein [Bacteroidota bacterium]|nr:FprA family A-type flavoprotein [Bacteroidota bacterium]
MKEQKILNVTDDVKWIGILDYDIVTFDVVMETKYGTTYNSYFINAEKKAIIETAKEKFKDTYLEKVRQVTDPTEIQYIILDHTEPDHSGSLKYLLEIAPNATVVGSGQALNYLADITGKQFKTLKVKDGDTLDLGNKTLKFIGAPNLHWPDSIYTYLVEDKILFTCDSFGAHFCNDAMFDDLVGNYDDAFKYYFDVILKPFSKFMVKAIEKIRPLEISAICPGHGPILRSNWKSVVDRSDFFAKEFLTNNSQKDNNILIAYVSAYGYTKEMAAKICEGILQAGDFNVHVVDIENILLGDLDEYLTRSNAIIVGSPTINQNTLLPVYRMFALINPIRDRGKLATTFGSYGWSGEAVKIIEANLKALKLNVFQEGLATKFFPHNGKAAEYIEFGKNFGLQMLQNKTSDTE